MSRKLRAAATLALMVASAGIAIPAYADNSGTLPSGCTITPGAPNVGGNGQVAWAASASCSSANNFNARLVHNYSGVPDVRVATAANQPQPKPHFFASDSTCDGGGTTQYYDEGALFLTNGQTVQRVSKTVTLSHC